jgi:hypothetical protein
MLLFSKLIESISTKPVNPSGGLRVVWRVQPPYQGAVKQLTLAFQTTEDRFLNPSAP